MVNAAPKKIIEISPTKAGLYAAILPGLGQAYNKKYWKIPIVLGAIGTGVGIAMWNDKQYRRYQGSFYCRTEWPEARVFRNCRSDKRCIGTYTG
jgi:hypothetical protein